MKAALVCAALCLVVGSSYGAHRPLPREIIAGYTNQANATTILSSVDDGLSVLIWSFIELQQGAVIADPVQGGPSPDDVAAVMAGLDSRNLSRHVVHLISIGGWGAPHPTVELS